MKRGRAKRGLRNGSKDYKANTRHLKRILLILKETGKPMTITEIARSLGDSVYIKDAMIFLESHGFVTCRRLFRPDIRKYKIKTSSAGCKFYLLNDINAQEVIDIC